MAKPPSCPHSKRGLDLAHEFGNAQLLIQDIVGKSLRWKVLELHFAARILPIEIAVVVQQLFGGDLPCLLVLFPLVPPRKARLEFVGLKRLGLSSIFLQRDARC